jgi:type IV pilus assembly protein PilA
VRLNCSLGSARDEEEGFTLIELMVVVLIIAILIAIAIPTFLGARERAENRAAQSDLRNALTAEKTYYTDGESYADSSAAGSTALARIEPLISWSSKVSWSTGDVAVGTSTVVAGAVCLQQTSRTGTTFALADVAVGTNAGTYFAATSCPATVNGAAFTGWQTGGW